MYRREDLSQKYTPLCSKISLTSCSRPRPCITSFCRCYIPEWFEANAVAYTLVVLSSRLARSLVGTPSHPHATSSSFCVSRIVCTVLFLFLFVCLSPLFARRTPDCVSFWSPPRGGFKYTLRLQSTSYIHIRIIYCTEFITLPLPAHLHTLNSIISYCLQL